jgi:transposase-like protein
MKCPRCQSTAISKNGFRGSKQNHRCRDCGRQFIDSPQTHRGYSDDVRELCLKMYLNGMGFRAIERVTEIHHTTIISWVQQAEATLTERDQVPDPPEVGEVDELQTFVGAKKTKCGFGPL